jgi:hypothetical protein
LYSAANGPAAVEEETVPLCATAEPANKLNATNKEERVIGRVRVICASSHIASPPSTLFPRRALVSAAMTVMMAVPAMTMMVVVPADVDHNLGIRRLGEGCSENESEEGVQKDFHI